MVLHGTPPDPLRCPLCPYAAPCQVGSAVMSTTRALQPSPTLQESQGAVVGWLAHPTTIHEIRDSFPSVLEGVDGRVKCGSHFFLRAAVKKQWIANV